MRESLRPACAAVVAAPIRNLWPLNLESSTPINLSASHSALTSRGLEVLSRPRREREGWMIVDGWPDTSTLL